MSYLNKAGNVLEDSYSYIVKTIPALKLLQ